MNNFETMEHKGKSFKLWNSNIPAFEEHAIAQMRNTIEHPVVSALAIMPDAHYGYGVPIGSVILTEKAIIPSAVGVDIGCGMVAVQTSLKAHDLPDSLADLRNQFERSVPMGRNYNSKIRDDAKIRLDKTGMYTGLEAILSKHPKISTAKTEKIALQMGTLGGGNHFIELCLDKDNNVWLMLHSGSRGIGNQIGRYFINKAKEKMETWRIDLPDSDLGFLPYGDPMYDDYIEAMNWAQDFAAFSREVMLERTLNQLERAVKPFDLINEAINCHHNYTAMENHNGSNVWVTRKGAVRARLGDLGIIPGSMGQRSFIVEGLGSEDSFHSCSHGAGRVMSRTQARKEITLDQHIAATEGVECNKTKAVLDESPSAYKNIDDVMASQSDLVKVVAELKAVLCCKGV